MATNFVLLQDGTSRLRTQTNNLLLLQSETASPQQKAKTAPAVIVVAAAVSEGRDKTRGEYEE